MINKQSRDPNVNSDIVRRSKWKGDCLKFYDEKARNSYFMLFYILKNDGNVQVKLGDKELVLSETVKGLGVVRDSGLAISYLSRMFLRV